MLIYGILSLISLAVFLVLYFFLKGNFKYISLVFLLLEGIFLSLFAFEGLYLDPSATNILLFNSVLFIFIGSFVSNILKKYGLLIDKVLSLLAFIMIIIAELIYLNGSDLVWSNLYNSLYLLIVLLLVAIFFSYQKIGAYPFKTVLKILYLVLPIFLIIFNFFSYQGQPAITFFIPFSVFIAFREFSSFNHEKKVFFIVEEISTFLALIFIIDFMCLPLMVY